MPEKGEQNMKMQAIKERIVKELLTDEELLADVLEQMDDYDSYLKGARWYELDLLDEFMSATELKKNTEDKMKTELQKEIENLELYIEKIKQNKNNYKYLKNEITNHLLWAGNMILALTDFRKYDEIEELVQWAFEKKLNLEKTLNELLNNGIINE